MPAKKTGPTPPRFDFDALYATFSWPEVNTAMIAGNTSLAKLLSAQARFVRRTHQALDV